MENDTIAAISTPAGRGGIGIIKISGKNAISIATSVFRRSSTKSIPQPADAGIFDSHRLYYGSIINPENKKVDEVLLSVMPGPNSYTKEDVVEINVHSGLLVLRTILDLVISRGARLAEPGEFTKRAFLNGRVDLTQAEAVIDLINAKSIRALEIANAQSDGGLRQYVQGIIGILTDILVKIEASIDFPEDTGIIDTEIVISRTENDVVRNLEKLISDYNEGHVLRDGLKIVIAGRPNVGKSSLMNQLLKKERAIVTSVPGTTRDVLEETLIVSGIHTVITDTAGLHESNDPVEMIGMKKTREIIAGADIILFMIDAVTPFIREDYDIYNIIKERPVIIVVNKIDKASADFVLCTEYELENLPAVKISALYNTGIDFLKETIKKLFENMTGLYSGDILPNIRQKKALEKGLDSVKSFVHGLKTGLPFELVSIDLKDAIDSLKEVIGLKIKDDLLDQIFSRFCIGK
jgi:tRNA modification GTPase